LVKIKVSDVSNSSVVALRAMIMQQKTERPAQFEITESTRDSIFERMRYSGAGGSDYLFPSRVSSSPRISTRQYARIVEGYPISV